MKNEESSFIDLLKELKNCRINSRTRKMAFQRLYNEIKNDLMTMCRNIIVKRGIRIEYDELAKDHFSKVIGFVIKKAPEFRFDENEGNAAVRGRFFSWLKKIAVNNASGTITEQYADHIQQNKKGVSEQKRKYLYELEINGVTGEELRRKSKKFQPSEFFSDGIFEKIQLKQDSDKANLVDDSENELVYNAMEEKDSYSADEFRKAKRNLMKKIIRQEFNKLKGVKKTVLLLYLKYGDKPTPSWEIDILVKKFGIKRGYNRVIEIRLIKSFFKKVRKRFEHEERLAFPQVSW